MSLTSRKLLAVVAVTAVTPACLDVTGSQCAEQTGPGVSGMIRYTTGDGAMLDATLDAAFMRMTRADAVKLGARFEDEWGRDREYQLELTGLAPAMLDLTGHGSLCMPRQTGSEAICSPLTGTIDVRQLDSECYTHESGISSCIETIELSVHGTSVWQDTRFEIDAEELTVGAWVECEI